MAKSANVISLLPSGTDYGCPMKPFFIEIPNFGLGQTIWTDKFWGIWGIFGRFISKHFGTESSLFMFSINQPIFLQKTIASILNHYAKN